MFAARAFLLKTNWYCVCLKLLHVGFTASARQKTYRGKKRVIIIEWFTFKAIIIEEPFLYAPGLENEMAEN